MKRKLFHLCWLLLLCPTLPLQAQTGDSLIINLKNGQTVVLPLSQIQKITFDTATTAVHEINSPAHSLEVAPSYPNPLQKGTTINFDIATSGTVKVAIYDNKGNMVRLLTSDCEAGQNRIEWDGRDKNTDHVPSGAYFYEVRFKGEVQTRQMVVIK